MGALPLPRLTRCRTRPLQRPRDSGGVRVLFVHHDANSGDGHVGRAFAALGAEITVHQVCADPGSPTGSTTFPAPNHYDQVVLFGSRWSVDDPQVAHWVEAEIEFLRAADHAGVPVLGLCFGGQILAVALGGSVGRTEHPEIGWLPVEVNAAGVDAGVEAGPWLQWHFDAFTVPPGATELARSPAGAQVFRAGPHLGLQFHPEADRDVLRGWMVDDLDQLVGAGLDAEALLAEADACTTQRPTVLVAWSPGSLPPQRPTSAVRIDVEPLPTTVDAADRSHSLTCAVRSRRTFTKWEISSSSWKRQRVRACCRSCDPASRGSCLPTSSTIPPVNCR